MSGSAGHVVNWCPKQGYQFVACVASCDLPASGRVAAKIDRAASGQTCPEGTFPATDCPAGSWSGPGECGPWVQGLDCGCGECCNGVWLCPPTCP